MLAAVETTGDVVTLTLCGMILLVAIPFMIMALAQKHFKSTWFCDTMGWHVEPGATGFDGCSMTGTCPRCHKDVMKDGQGNWF